MTLAEAIKSGKSFRRPSWDKVAWVKSGCEQDELIFVHSGFRFRPSVLSILATDYVLPSNDGEGEPEYLVVLAPQSSAGEVYCFTIKEAGVKKMFEWYRDWDRIKLFNWDGKETIDLTEKESEKLLKYRPKESKPKETI